MNLWSPHSSPHKSRAHMVMVCNIDGWNLQPIEGICIEIIGYKGANRVLSTAVRCICGYSSDKSFHIFVVLCQVGFVMEWRGEE